jgi:hypothetical protein
LLQLREGASAYPSSDARLLEFHRSITNGNMLMWRTFEVTCAAWDRLVGISGSR